jgi:t-SNARE complex subunit (syntaxin)
LRSNRSGQATSALGAVRARHNELQQIEKSLTELAALFADMAQIVEAQEPVVQRTEENAIQAQENVDKGNVEINKATEHARRRRRLKWYCLLVVVCNLPGVMVTAELTFMSGPHHHCHRTWCRSRRWIDEDGNQRCHPTLKGLP